MNLFFWLDGGVFADTLITQHNTSVLPSITNLISETHLAEEIQLVLQKACAKEPSARYGSAMEMREGVLAVVQKPKREVPKEAEPKKTKESYQRVEAVQVDSKPVVHIEKEKQVMGSNSTENMTNPNKKIGKILVGVVGVIVVGLGISFFQERGPSKMTTNSIGMEFALIPAGDFMMGCSDGDENCQDDEKPQHKVAISNSFYIGKYEVTQGQWKRVMGNNPSYFQNCGENCPVEQVSWNDVQDFIKKLCELEKMNPCKYRLPTEAEWEYAARAGSITELYNGKLENNGYFESKNLDRIGWFAGNAKATYEGGYSIRDLSVNKGLEFYKDAPHQFTGTQVVGKKEPNAWGLYDMIGNVLEWNEDWYDEKYYDKTPLLDPKGADKGGNRVLRGGSWDYDAGYSRLSNRYFINPDYRGYDYGFRLVLLP